MTWSSSGRLRTLLHYGLSGALFGMILAAAAPTWAQSLSQQVLTLLSRTNTWTGVNTYQSTVGLILQNGGVQPTGGCTDRLYNLGHALFFNCLAIAASGGGSGTVTSVALTAPGAVFAVGGSPINGSGTLALTFQTQGANNVWAGPTSGGAVAPTFRALVDADVPDTITINGTNTVTWASVNKTGSSLADLTTRSAADLGSGKLALARLTTGGTSGQPLLAGATDPAYGALDLTSATAISGQLAAANFPVLAGDLTTPGGSLTTTLAATTVVAAAYGSATQYATFTVDAKGRLTAASSLDFPTHNLLSATHTDTLAAAVTRGGLIYGNATPAWAKLALGASGSVVRSDGTDLAWSTDGSSLTVSGTNVTTGTVAIARGGTNSAAVATAGGIAYGTGTAYAFTGVGVALQCLVSNGAAAPTWGACATLANHNLLSATHTDTVAASATRGAIIVGNSTPAWASVTPGTVGQVLRTDGTDVAWSSDGSGLTTLSATALTSGTVPLSRLSNIADSQIAAGAAITWSKLATLLAADVVRWVSNSVAGTQIIAATAVGGQAQGIIIQRGDGTNQVFANLGAATNGTLIYCADCLHGSNPCTGASTGAFAKRLNGAWVCN